MSLIREDHPCWSATCDRCGEGDNQDWGVGFHYPDEATAKEALRESDWRQALDGSWLCNDCFDEARREQYACPHGAGCTGGGCGGECPIPFTAEHNGPRRPVGEPA